MADPVQNDPIAAVPKAEPKPRILDKDFGLSTFKRNTWFIEIYDPYTMSDVLNEQFWSPHADKVMGQDKAHPKGVKDFIDVYKQRTNEHCRLMITAVGKGYIRVKKVEEIREDVVSEPPSPLMVSWNVGKRCHEVVRKSDKMLMASNFQTKADAVAWIDEHMKAMAA